MVACQLTYGDGRRFQCDVPDARLIGIHPAPPALADLRTSVQSALRNPVEFPAFEDCVFPGDRVVLVLDRDTPCAADLIAEIWSGMARRDVRPEDVLIIHPATLVGSAPADPRCNIAADVRSRIEWKVHDPTSDDDCAYLATTTNGERIYLARDVVEADVVVTIGSIGYHPLLGYRGTNSAFYPGLSKVDAMRRAHGQGHDELSPDDPRPLRQVVDEIGWLLGTQFTLQVIPAEGNAAAAVVAGLSEPTFEQGKRLLDARWRMDLDERPELVVASITQDAAGHGWDQLAAALNSARQLVARDGRVVVLTELAADVSDGIQMVRDSRSPRDALRPIRQAAPPDLIAATQLAQALDWMNVYLLSSLDPRLVEDLFMIPLADTSEVLRAISGDERCVFISGAQHVSVAVR